MWLHCCFFVLTLFPTKINLANPQIEIDDEAEEIFTNVMRNMSRVNNVLQKLINQYDNAKAVYKSHFTENSETQSEESDIEIDERFKNTNYGDTELTTRKSGYPATAIFFSEHDNTQESYSKESDKETVSAPPMNFAANFFEQPLNMLSMRNSNRTTTDSSTSESTETSSSDETTKENFDIPTTTGSTVRLFTNTRKTTTTREDKYNKSREKSKESKSSNEDIAKNKKKTNEVVRNILNNAFKSSKQNADIKKDLNLELKNSKNEMKLRSLAQAFDLQNMTNNSSIKTLLGGDFDSDDNNKEEDDETAIIRDKFKTSVLRKAYGDACLNLVVKKCYKACKATSKASCSRVKCKSGFKDKFLLYSKEGCTLDFSGSPLEPSPPRPTYRGQENTGLKSEASEKNTFVDLTRGGYLAGACLPFDKSSAKQKKSKKSINRTSPDNNLNILRDKLERECQKTSADKCYHVCMKSYTDSCKIFTCNSDMKKHFKKGCKLHCKTAFKAHHSDSSDSDSDSYSDSDSSESSESEEDDDDK